MIVIGVELESPVFGLIWRTLTVTVVVVGALIEVVWYRVEIEVMKEVCFMPTDRVGESGIVATK